MTSRTIKPLDVPAPVPGNLDKNAENVQSWTKIPLRGWNNMPKKQAKISGARVIMRTSILKIASGYLVLVWLLLFLFVEISMAKPLPKIVVSNVIVVYCYLLPKGIPEKTDSWRKTRGNFIVDTAPFHWHKVSSNDFDVVCFISADLGYNFDRAGLMIRIDDKNWIYSGIEYIGDDIVAHSTCVTRDYTDWSVTETLPPKTEKKGIWCCIRRIGKIYETYYSMDGKDWLLSRQGMFPIEGTVYVGIFGACPQGVGFKANFDYYVVREL